MTVTSSPALVQNLQAHASEYLYPSLKICPISTDFWISSGSPVSSDVSPSATCRRSKNSALKSSPGVTFFK